jgi:hypothetical protein
MPATALIPFDYQRQFAGPIDKDLVFVNSAARNAYLTSPRRYAGMLVADLETQSTWMLNAAMTEWIIVGPRVLPHDLHYTAFGGMVADTVVGQQLFSRHVVVNQNFDGSLAYAATAPTTTSSVFRLVNSTTGEIGTITFAQGSNSGVFAPTTPNVWMPQAVGTRLTLRTHATTFDTSIRSVSIIVNANSRAFDADGAPESEFP